MADNVIVKVGEKEWLRGEDGFDPVVTVEDIEHGHRVTITDREHPVEGQSFDVLDGASAYEQAVAGGYEGTEAEFNADLAGFSEKEQAATNAAAAAAQSAQNAADSASTATTKAGEAADSAAAALTRMNSANSSATAAAASATAAGNAKTAAEDAQGLAEDAQEAAEQAQSDAEAAAQSVSQSAAQISQNASDISDLKSALGTAYQKMAYAYNDSAEDYLDFLKTYSTLNSITADFAQPPVVYGDNINNLKKYLNVIAIFQNGERVNVPDELYTLSGIINNGINEISVEYEGKTTTFTATIKWVPSEYQAVEYIEGTGTQYITTNIISQIPLKASGKFMRRSDNPGQVLGSGDSANERFFMLGVVRSNQNKIAVRYGAGAAGNIESNLWSGFNESLPENTVAEFESAVEYIGERTKSTIRYNGEYVCAVWPTPVIGDPIEILRATTANSASPGRFYYIKISNENDIFYGIPCYRKSDNVAGMYDIVNDVFYTNAGTGSFAVGNPI